MRALTLLLTTFVVFSCLTASFVLADTETVTATATTAAAAASTAAPSPSATSTYVQPPIIRVGVLAAVSSTSSSDVSLGYTDVGSAIKLGFDKLNNDSFIPGTTFQVTIVDIKTQQLDLSVFGTLDMIQNKNIHVLIGPPAISPTRVVAGVTGALGVPQLGFVTDDEMTNKILYPTYNRMQPSNTYIFTGVLRTIKAFGWNRIAAIDSSVGPLPTAFFTEAKRLNITIATRITLTSGNYANLPELIELLVASRANIFVCSLSTLPEANTFFPYAVNASLVGPDKIWFGGRTEIGFAQAYTNKPLFHGMMSVVYGVTLTAQEYIDYWTLYGQHWDDPNYPRRSPKTSASAGPVTSLGFDAAMVTGRIVKDLIEKQLSVNATNFQKSLSKLNFRGASGPLTFDIVTGDRMMPLHLKVLRLNGAVLTYDLNAEVAMTENSVKFNPFLPFSWPNLKNVTVADLNHNFTLSAVTGLFSGAPADFSCAKPCIHGTCVAMDTCVCDEPELWSGATCDTKRYVEWSDPEAIAITVIASVFSFFALIIVLILIAHKDNPAVRKSSVWFCTFMAVGFVIGYLSMLAYIGKPSVNVCLAQIWVPTIAFGLVFANLLAKTWRINLIFNNTKLKTLAVRDADLLRFSGAILFMEVVILVIWSVAFTPEAIDAILNDGTVVTTCGNNSQLTGQKTMMGILFGFNLALIAFAAILAYRTRKANYSYRESRFIGYAVYNILFCSVVFFALLLSLEVGTTISFALKQLCTFLMVTFTLCVLLLPKVAMVLKYTPEQQAALFESKERKHDNTTKHSSQNGRKHSSQDSGMSSPAAKHSEKISMTQVKRSSDDESQGGQVQVHA